MWMSSDKTFSTSHWVVWYILSVNIIVHYFHMSLGEIPWCYSNGADFTIIDRAVATSRVSAGLSYLGLASSQWLNEHVDQVTAEFPLHITTEASANLIKKLLELLCEN